MRKLLTFTLLAASLFAQKKPITLETLNEGGRGGGGGRGGAATWAPDGKSFVFRQGRSLMLYDPATKTSKELVSTDAMDSAAVKGPPEDGPVDWTNRRASLGGMQWSQSGKELLYMTGGDIFLVHVDATAAADPNSPRWTQITKTPQIEYEAKLSPDAKAVAFRRGYDLYSIDIASGKETRLTKGGTETLRNGT